MIVNGIRIYIARCLRTEAGWLRWSVRRRIHLDSQWIVALRMDLSGAKVLDYMLLPVAGFPKQMVEFSYEHPTRLEGLPLRNDRRIDFSTLGKAPHHIRTRPTPEKHGDQARAFCD
jgi:hypothetical protein